MKPVQEIDNRKHRQADGGRNVCRIGRHVGALQHDRTHFRVFAAQVPGRRYIILPGGIDIEFQYDFPCIARVNSRPPSVVPTGVCGGTPARDSKSASKLEAAMVRIPAHLPPGSSRFTGFNLQQRRGYHRHRQGSGKFGLKSHQEPTGGGDRHTAFSGQFPTCRKERVQQPAGILDNDAIRRGAFNGAIRDRIGKGLRIADIAPEAAENGSPASGYRGPVWVDLGFTVNSSGRKGRFYKTSCVGDD